MVRGVSLHLPPDTLTPPLCLCSTPRSLRHYNHIHPPSHSSATSSTPTRQEHPELQTGANLSARSNPSSRPPPARRAEGVERRRPFPPHPHLKRNRDPSSPPPLHWTPQRRSSRPTLERPNTRGAGAVALPLNPPPPVFERRRLTGGLCPARRPCPCPPCPPCRPCLPCLRPLPCPWAWLRLRSWPSTPPRPPPPAQTAPPRPPAWPP